MASTSMASTSTITATVKDQTEAAKALVSAVVHTFYDEKAVSVVEYLMSNSFLRDGETIERVQQVPETLRFLQKQQLVSLECVEGRVEQRNLSHTPRRTGRANFWYLNYRQLVATIPHRLKLIQAKWEKDIYKAGTSSIYKCPGYKAKLCNGLYTEKEVLSCPICPATGNFLCLECHQIKPSHCYILQQADDAQATLDAQEKLNRFLTQMTEKNVYQHLQRLKVITLSLQSPVTSNLPSENGARELLMHNPTNFAAEAAEEFSNTIYVTGMDGQRLVLDVESGTGVGAHLSPIIDGGPVQHTTTKEIPKPINCRTKSMETSQDLPRPKRVCRNATPNVIPETNRTIGVEGLTDQARLLSLWNPDKEEFGLANTESTVQVTAREQETCSVWLAMNNSARSMNNSTVLDRAQVQQLVQQIVKTHKMPRRASSYPPSTASASSCTFDSVDTTSRFGSLDWPAPDSETRNQTERDNNSGAKSAINIIDLSNSPSPNIQRKQTSRMSIAAFRSVDMLESSFPDLQSKELLSSLDFEASLRNSLKGVDNATLRKLIPGPPLGLDDFALGKGGWSSIEWNTGRPGLGDILGNSYNQLQPKQHPHCSDSTAGKTRRDSLTFFKSSDFLENNFATTDLQELFRQLGEQPLKSQPKNPDHLTSMDWLSFDMVPDGAISASVFRTRDVQKPAANVLKTDSADRFMRMYRDGLNPKNAASTATSQSNASTVSVTMAWPVEVAATANAVPASSLFPPPTDKMVTLPTMQSAAVSHPTAKMSHRAVEKFTPVSAKASKLTKKSINGEDKAAPDVKVFVKITDLDVLCQRGTKSRLHPGNERYRRLVESRKPEYRAIKDKYLKTKFVEDLVHDINRYGARFLEKDSASGSWYIISDVAARRKAGQALRDENTPEARKEKRNKYSKTNKHDDSQDEEV